MLSSRALSNQGLTSQSPTEPAQASREAAGVNPQFSLARIRRPKAPRNTPFFPDMLVLKPVGYVDGGHNIAGSLTAKWCDDRRLDSFNTPRNRATGNSGSCAGID